MIEMITDLPDNVVGFTAKGTITAKDYESIIMPAVEKLFSRHDKGRFLYVLGDEFSGFEAGAMWDDTKLGLKHLTGWEKIAVVSDVEWVLASVRLFGLAIPGHVRIFHQRDQAEATHWIAE
ncbi:MAG: STAS/SEC14 domain-containing protein [Thiomonas sp.]